MRRFINIPGITIALWLVWKAGLLLFTAQPVPANDAFFYDGAVVNYLQHGNYCNPSLAEVLPISGTEVFSAYPPLYQAVLWAWLKCFGTSALAVMWLHFGLLALFAGTVWAVFRQLQVPVALANLAALFLFGITFHDRPDTLAHVFGALVILAWVRGLPWAGSVFLLLTFGTSLQIGGIYLLWAGALSLATTWAAKEKFPWGAWLTFGGVGLALVALVKFGYPRLWEGFQEHAAMTPSFTGFRLPQRDECLKVIRTAPGIFLAFALLPFVLGRLSEPAAAFGTSAATARAGKRLGCGRRADVRQPVCVDGELDRDCGLSATGAGGNFSGRVREATRVDAAPGLVGNQYFSARCCWFLCAPWA
jgi:hypothetical protein